MTFLDHLRVFAALAIALGLIFLAAATGWLDGNNRAQRWAEFLAAYTLLLLAITTAPL